MKFAIKPAFLAVPALALAACATAQTETEATAPVVAAAPAPAPPPCEDDIYHAFDFWIGDWDVYDLSGNLVGANSITSEESGCLLIEHWTNTGGGTGQSYNFYDPGTNEWRQIWVSAAGVIDYSGGLTDTGSMLLKGEIRNRGAGGVAPFTGEWTLNADGSVTQHFQQQDPATGEWSDWFIGQYVRQATE